MTHRPDVARGREIVARWCNLAEKRLEHLTELFETGRWRRYHSERAFLENIQEAKAAVETWRDLLRREASRENIEIDISWLGRTRVTPLPRADGLSRRIRALSPQPAPVSAEISRSVLAAVSQAIGVSLHASSNEAPSVPAIDLAAFEPDLSPTSDVALDTASQVLLDIARIQERYPLLRHTL
ncbi:TIGR03809 family protein [Bradyrhizobium canariense]|uniref:TIGR03809 family protein n=1 Tax=Bradyrhizobium canariense TaxID=255045 RepID=A0A1H1TIK4_9BRAD|nr:TIGR03809 family protein [Bradyrhizobium canariense]SDS59901.1 TIGR03809 family protein [Bradyrhizobium canariense]